MDNKQKSAVCESGETKIQHQRTAAELLPNKNNHDHALKKAFWQKVMNGKCFSACKNTKPSVIYCICAQKDHRSG